MPTHFQESPTSHSATQPERSHPTERRELSAMAMSQLATLLGAYEKHFQGYHAILVAKKTALLIQDLEQLKTVDVALLEHTKGLQRLDIKRQQWQQAQGIDPSASLNACLSQIAISPQDPLGNAIAEQSKAVAQHVRTLAQLSLQVEAILQQSLHWIAYSVQTIADLMAPPSPTYSDLAQRKKGKLSPHLAPRQLVDPSPPPIHQAAVNTSAYTSDVKRPSINTSNLDLDPDEAHNSEGLTHNTTDRRV
jgi:hypothetical protein